MNRGVSIWVFLAFLAGSLMVLPGCSRKGTPPGTTGTPPLGVDKPSDAASSRRDVKDWEPALGTATISGSVLFAGEAPRRRRIDMSATEQCSAEHTGTVLEESVIVNSNGTLKNVFVWVKKGLEGWRFAAPAEPVVLEQTRCMFLPHVLGVQTRQKLLIRNNDPLLHNVHTLSKRNRSFNFGQPTKGTEDTVDFKVPEVMVKLKCDLHGWMSSFIGVVPHPFFVVTGDDGKFELANLPPGEYTVEAWHEVYGTKTAVIRVGDKESKEHNFSFEDA